MTQVAFITGATDGIGQALAYCLAAQGYTLHLLGRDAARGQASLAEVQRLNPEGQHRLFLQDLSDLTGTDQFLRDYCQNHDRLDLLVLNALPHGKATEITSEGVESIFAVGCLSRYLFAVRLDAMLRATSGSRVMHMADPRNLASLNFDQIREGKYGVGKATFTAYAGSSLLAYQLNRGGYTAVPHEVMYPGAVKTRQMDNQGLFTKLLLKMVKPAEPADAAATITKHLDETQADNVAGKLFYLEEPIKHGEQLLLGEAAFNALVEFAEAITGVKLEEMAK